MQHRTSPAAGSSAANGEDRLLVLATGNAGKLREFRALLQGLPLRVEPQSAFGVTPADETGTSFLDNALLKARHAALATGAAVIADDSGLEVDALQGAPGVWSARFAGPAADDAANNARLLEALAGLGADQRRARYRCVLVYLPAGLGPRDPADAAPLIAEGVWEGVIIDTPRGDGGFGYDPYFWVPELGKTAAELDPVDKNRLSHRGTAMRAMRELLERGGLVPS
jgi:XTP/dITP diphosphohydrolase